MKDRPCGTKTDHVPHPWDGGRHRCNGYGRFAGVQSAPAPNAPRCTTTWVGPTGIVWDCVAAEHPTDPTRGYCGSGHEMVARPRIGEMVDS